MTIENHVWFDEDACITYACEDYVELDVNDKSDYPSLVINKADAKAIAKHFGLVGKKHDIDALIKEYDPPKDWKEPDFNKSHRFDWKEYADDLADEWHLLTDKQKIIISAGAASRADINADHCF